MRIRKSPKSCLLENKKSRLEFNYLKNWSSKIWRLEEINVMIAETLTIYGDLNSAVLNSGESFPAKVLRVSSTNITEWISLLSRTKL